MPQFIHFKNEIGLNDLILSSSRKKKENLNMCFFTEIIPK